MKYFYEVDNKGAGTHPEQASQKDINKAIKQKEKLDKINDKLEKLEEQKKKLLKNCLHIVRYDEQGFMYDSRFCLACGAHLSLI